MTIKFKIINQILWKWICSLLILFMIYFSIWNLYSDKYQTGSNSIKYDISAEIFKRLLFTSEIEKIDEYCLAIYDENYNIMGKGFGSAITDRRPLYFLFLSVLKLFNTFPVGLNYFINITLLLCSLVIMGYSLRTTNTHLFVLIGGLLLSPFMVYHSYIYEPHVLEIFLTCLGLFFYMKKRYLISFFILTLSIFSHYGNLVLVGCLGLFHFYSYRKNSTVIVKSAIGGFAAWIAIEILLLFLFSRDIYEILPNNYMIEQYLFSDGGVKGGWAKSTGIIHYWNHSIIFMPIATVGIFLIRNKIQFVITLLPVLIYLVASEFHMQGAYRVLLPVYFISFSYFLFYFLTLKSVAFRAAWLSLAMLSLVFSICYYYSVSKSLGLKESTSVALSGDLKNASSSINRKRLYWNLKRFNQVMPKANITYNIKKISLNEDCNIPSPWCSYRHLMRQQASKWMSDYVLKNLGFEPSTDLWGFALIRVTTIKPDIRQ